MKILLVLAACALAATGDAAKPGEQAKLTLEQATARAKDEVKGGSVERVQLAHEKGKAVWDVDVRTSSDVIKEVWINAESGAVERLETVSAPEEEAYAGAAREQIDQLQGKIDELKRNASTKGEQARRDADAAVKQLEAKKADAEARLKELEEAGQARWTTFKAGLDRALLELREGYDAAMSSGTAPGKPASQPKGRR
jgi:TolA-binding protein